ncbi:S41 family peptidase [uncultured Pontibacter sp.]|uniref:S41 family peptidase n=1 Tax=uncultured Pontibacter sp. TaxID=453356 RepID=UPI00262472D9|nr:S41 family peptidase [uncultured Pontibacter sp.]
MKKSLALLLILIIATTQHVFSQALPDSIQSYVMEALDIMRENSINKHSINWEKLYTETLDEANKAKTIRDTYPVIYSATQKLEDGHSKFYSKELVEAHLVGYRALGQKMPMPSGNMIDGKYAYIIVPAFGVFDPDEQLLYADSLQAIIRALDAQHPKGWIIDLRHNDGGNMHPMLAGLAPLLGEGELLGWQTPDHKVEYSAYKNGVVRDIHGKEYTIPAPYAGKNTKAPMSILISGNTASSAEMVAAAFIGRQKTKLIGTRTNGLTTSNTLYKLSDGAYLNLTTSKMVDRTGKVYGEKIAPDVEVQLTRSATTNSYLYISTAIQHINKPKK